MTDGELEDELVRLSTDPLQDDAEIVFEELAKRAHERFPHNEVLAAAAEYDLAAFRAKRLLVDDEASFFTEGALRRVYNLTIVDSEYYKCGEDQRDLGRLCEYLGLRQFRVAGADGESLVPAPGFWGPPATSPGPLYCREDKVDEFLRFFDAYSQAVAHDQLASVNMSKETAREKRLLWLDKTRVPTLPEGLTCFGVVTGWLLALKDYRLCLAGHYLGDGPAWCDAPPWVLHLGDIGDVEVSTSRRTWTENESMSVHHFDGPALPSKPAGIGKSALVGGLLAGPTGAVIGAGYGLDRASRAGQQRSREVSVETFEFTNTRTGGEDYTVLMRHRYVEGMELTLKLFDSEKIRFCHVNGFAWYQQFIELLKDLVSRGRVVRTLELGWITEHGTLDGFDAFQDSDEWIQAVAAIDAKMAEELTLERAQRRALEEEQRRLREEDARAKARAIADDKARYSRLGEEKQRVSEELEQLGSARFGQRARRKKELQAKLGEVEAELANIANRLAGLGATP